MTDRSGLIAVHELSVVFSRHQGWGHATVISALRGVSLAVGAGEIVAVIGSSGAGKSVLAHAILGILPGNAELTGEILYRGQAMTKQQLAELRGREIALVPQSIGFLDPLIKVGRAVRWAAQRSGLTRTRAAIAQRRAFERLGLPTEVGNLYPFQLSGGMARRILLAMATVGTAHLLIMDEPTPGLHPEAVRESMQQLRHLVNQGNGVLLISHDISACLSVADRVVVLLDGAVVEIAPASSFSGDGTKLEHAYSRALWNALPENSFAAPSPPAELAVEVRELTSRNVALPAELMGPREEW